MPCAAVGCSFVFPALPKPTKQAGGERPVKVKCVQPDHVIALKPNSKVGDPLCYSCAAKDVRMRHAASASDSESGSREVARITTERLALGFSLERPPAASTRRAQKAVDKLQALSAAATGTSFVSPTRIVRLTSDEKLLPSASQLVVMPLVHYVTLARMLTCGQVMT